MTWRSTLHDPVLRDFIALERGSRRIVARRGYEGWAEGIGAQAPERMIPGGRAEHPLLPLPGGGAALVRRYHRGGMIRHVIRDHYLLGHRAFEEIRATVRAEEAGVRVPEALAAIEERRGLGYGAMLATRWIPEVEPLDRWLAAAGTEARAEVLRSAGEQIVRMHSAGIAHPDINLRNLLVGGDPPVVHLIDFDRARVGEQPVSPSRRRADLLRLARSATKLGHPFAAADWRALATGYGAAWPLAGRFG